MLGALPEYIALISLSWALLKRQLEKTKQQSFSNGLADIVYLFAFGEGNSFGENLSKFHFNHVRGVIYIFNYEISCLGNDC